MMNKTQLANTTNLGKTAKEATKTLGMDISKQSSSISSTNQAVRITKRQTSPPRELLASKNKFTVDEIIERPKFRFKSSMRVNGGLGAGMTSRDHQRDNSVLSNDSRMSGTNVSIQSSFSAIKSNLLRFKYNKDPNIYKNIGNITAEGMVAISLPRGGAQTPQKFLEKKKENNLSLYHQTASKHEAFTTAKASLAGGMTSRGSKLSNPLAKEYRIPISASKNRQKFNATMPSTKFGSSTTKNSHGKKMMIPSSDLFANTVYADVSNQHDSRQKGASGLQTDLRSSSKD